MPRRNNRSRNNRAESPVDPLREIKNKFKRLKELQEQIAGMKALYTEHDALMTELLPLFIERDSESFRINREITLGRKRYRFNPSFFDSQKGLIVSKVWRSSAFPTGTIE